MIKENVASPETVGSSDGSQKQTADCFGYKWSKRDTYDSEQFRSRAAAWLVERYLDGDPALLDAWLSGGRKRILDAGCGSGFSGLLFFGERLKNHDYVGVDISSAVRVAEERFRQAGLRGRFIQADLMCMPFEDESFDIVFSEGVLHHTDDTGRAVVEVSRKLKPGGLFMFYVYAKKSKIREYTDDFIRERIKDLSDDEAWEALMPLTKLGKVLGEVDAEIDVPVDVPMLGIRKGRYSLQRFIYWNICKLFYREEFTLEEMNHINFDWFRPLNCHRHTREEVEAFCEDAGLTIERMCAQPAGFSVIARK